MTRKDSENTCEGDPGVDWTGSMGQVEDLKKEAAVSLKGENEQKVVGGRQAM